MAARPLWKGQLRLSLVAMAMELHSATRTGGRIPFRQIHGPSGKPIRYEKVVPGIGPVDRDEIMKGYELDKDSYVLLETLHYEDEIREAEPIFSSIGDADVPEDLLEVATTLIDKKTSAFDVSRFTDNYTVAIHELIERKTRSKSTKKVSTGDDEDRPPGTDNVIDLMAALKKSLQNTTDREGNSRRKKPAKKKAHSTATSKKRKRA